MAGPRATGEACREVGDWSCLAGTAVGGLADRSIATAPLGHGDAPGLPLVPLSTALSGKLDRAYGSRPTCAAVVFWPK
jgi:hypothetical protein